MLTSLFAEDAEGRLQSQQPPVQCATPISGLEGQMLDFNAVEFMGLGSPADAAEDAGLHSWYWYVVLALQSGHYLIDTILYQGSIYGRVSSA